MNAGVLALVLLPNPTSVETCLVTERLAAVMALIPEVRLVRADLQENEKVGAAKTRLGTDIGIGVEGDALVIANFGEAKQKIGDDPAEALALLWPPDRPKLPKIRPMGAANRAALEAACKEDVSAYAASGVAIGPVVRDRVDPPPKIGNTILARWAQAAAHRRKQDQRRALIGLRSVVTGLERGELGPTWRRAAEKADTPASLSVAGPLVISFVAGRFTALDATTGETRWSVEVGKADPALVEQEGTLLAFPTDRLLALEPSSGKARWAVKLHAPAFETVGIGTRLYAAGTKEVVAVDLETGKEHWRKDPLIEMIAGPVMAKSELAVPAGSFILLLDPQTGEEKRRVDVGDEISAPLAVTPGGDIWVSFGSDRFALVDPKQGEVKKKITGLSGMEWPAVIAGERWVIARRRGRRTTINVLDATTRGGVGKVISGGASPLLRLPDFSGFIHPNERPLAIVARDLEGRPRWTTRQPARVASLFTAGDVVVGAVGRRAVLLDPQNGKQLSRVDLDKRILEVVLGPEGGAAVTEDGTIYGLPARSDPRPTTWLEQARMALARTYVEVNQSRAALALAQAILARNPHSLEARAIAARAQEKLSWPDAVAAWRKQLAEAPLGEPSREEAKLAMAKLAGIEARLALDKPIVAVTATRTQMVLLAGGQATRRRIAKPETVLKAMPAKSIGTAERGFVMDDRLPGGGKITAGMKILSDRIFTVEARKLTRHGRDGSALWSQTFDTDFNLLAANEAHVLIGSPGTLQLLDAGNGARKWMLPFEQAVDAALLSTDAALLALPTQYQGLKLLDGKPIYTVRINPQDVSAATATADSFVLTAARLILIDQKSGRMRRVAVRSKIEHVAIPEKGSMILALESGHLVAVDPRRALVTSRIPFEGFSALVAAGERVLALEKAGALLIIDATSGLRPGR